MLVIPSAIRHGGVGPRPQVKEKTFTIGIVLTSAFLVANALILRQITEGASRCR